MTDLYSARNWYWIVGGDESRVWSSSRRAEVSANQDAYVLANDADYQAFLARGNLPTRIASEPDLWEVMAVQAPGLCLAAPVSARQARLAINTIPGLRDQIEAAVAAADRNTRDMWEYSAEIHRDNPYLAALAAQIGLTAQQIDDLFAVAKTM